MRVVATADIHNSTPKMPDGDVLIVCGDLTDTGTSVQMKRFCGWLGSQTHKHKIVIAGNHDFCLQNRYAPSMEDEIGKVATYLLDKETTIDGKRFYGSPWQPWFHDWAFNLERGKPLADKWALIPHGLDVLITHGPPFGYGDAVYGGQRVGCVDLMNRIEVVKPKYTVYGHIHEDAGERRHPSGHVLINCSSDYGTRPPAVFDL